VSQYTVLVCVDGIRKSVDVVQAVTICLHPWPWLLSLCYLLCFLYYMNVVSATAVVLYTCTLVCSIVFIMGIVGLDFSMYFSVCKLCQCINFLR